MSTSARVLRFATTSLLIALCIVLPAHAQETEEVTIQEQSNPLSFPREIKGDAGTVVIHTPQIDTWPAFKTVGGRLAVEVTPAGEKEAVYGVAEFTADTDPNLELRVVAVENTKIIATSFPVENDTRRELLDSIVRTTIQPQTQFVPLDVILSYIAPNAKPAEVEGLSFDPPPIFFSSTPAVLVITDGEPLLAQIPDTKLEYAVNTNWDLFRYNEKYWYLRNGEQWLKNKELGGEWKYDNSLPSHFKKLPDDGNWNEVKAAMPPTKSKEDEPTVFVSDRPAELILIDGAPLYRAVGVPGLEYVDDTESDLFRYETEFYYLVSGRWFKAQQPRGPWEYVKELPDIFRSIPPDHKKGHVLAAVPDTDEARLATLEAALPRKATISRDAGKDVSVYYQGEPQFEAIPGTVDVERAVNSSNDIVKVGAEYYLCDNAVWYVSTTAIGPWIVADQIPSVIYTIPPSSASYHVTHVHVYEAESDSSSVSTGYTSGYFGMTVAFGVAMYGTGWYYPPYYGYPHYGYPYYYPYPYSYGGSAWYNPNTGRHGRSASVYGPYGRYGRASSYNPQTGAYARGGAVWDNDEIAGSAIGYNPRTGTGVATNRYANESGGWGESLITHNDKWMETQSQWDADSRSTQFRTSEGTTGQIERQQYEDKVLGTGEFQRGDQSLDTKSIRGDQGTLIGYETGSGEQGVIGRTDDGDLYAGKDGQVYKRDEDGWQQHGDDGWNPVEVPDERAAQIDQKRAEASERAQTSDRTRSADGQARSQAQTTMGSGGLAQNYGGGGGLSNRTYDSSRNSGSFDSNRRNELNRSYDARSSGYQRYNNRSTTSRQRAGGRSMQRRRR
jgi:hypothetical protein